jgi:hypothetical protein
LSAINFCPSGCQAKRLVSRGKLRVLPSLGECAPL